MWSPDRRLCTAVLHTLWPTQMTVGMRGVEHKRQAWREASDKDAFLNNHVIPVVAGPDNRFFAIDHHHTARALLDEGVEQAKAAVVADLSELPERIFWNFLDQRAWCRPYNAQGERCDIEGIPTGLAGLQDDPYRSLVADVQKRGGFAEGETPFSEFLWADFYRVRLESVLLQGQLDAAVEQALVLARSRQARYLPGWCGHV